MTLESTGQHRRGRSMGSSRKEKEDLALFEDLALRDDLDSPLAMEMSALTSGYRVSSRRGIGSDLLNSDTDKNDYDWLMTPPETPLSPELNGQTGVVMNRTLSAIKTSRNPASRVEPATNGLRRNPSPTRSSKSPQRPSTSKSPRPTTASMSTSGLYSSNNRRSSPHNSRPSTPTVSSHDPFKPSTPRVSSSHRPSTPTMRPSTPTGRSTSTTRTTTAAAARNGTSAAKSSTRSPIMSSTSTSTTASTGRRSSPGTHRQSVTSSRVTPSTPRGSTQAAPRGASPPVSNKVVSRGSSPVRSGVSRGNSPVRGNKSPARGPSPTTRRGPSPPKGPSKPILAYDFLSETPANLRTTSVHSRGPGGLSRSTDGLGNHQLRRHSTSPSNFQNYISKSQDRGPNSLNRSQDRGTNHLSKSQDRGPMYLSKSQDRGQMYLSKSQDRGPNFSSKSQDRGSSLNSSQSNSNRRASLDDQNVPTRKVTIPEYGLDGRRLSTGSRDVSQTARASLARRTTLQQEPAFGNAMMRRSTDSTASRSVGFSTQQSSLNSSGGFKPFMTNSSIPSFYNAIPSMSLHRKLHQMDSEPPLTPSSPSGSDLSGGMATAATRSTSWEATQLKRDSKPLGSSLPDRPDKGESSSEDQKNLVKRQQMGFELKREDVRMANRVWTETAASRAGSQAEIKPKRQEEGAKHTGYPPGLVEGQGQVKIYQGLGDMEDMGGSWCCGMDDHCRSFCKKHECGIYKKFHNALVLSSPEFSNRSVSDKAEEVKSKQDEQEDADWERASERSTGVSAPRAFSSNRPRIEVNSMDVTGSPSDTHKTRSPSPESIVGRRSRESPKLDKEESLSDWESGSSMVSPHYQEPKSGQVSPVQYQSPKGNSVAKDVSEAGVAKADSKEARGSSPGWDKEDKLRPSISYAADHDVGRRQSTREKTVRRHSPLKPHDSVMSQGFRSGSVTPEDTSPLDVRAPVSILRGHHQSRQRKPVKAEPDVKNGSNWDLEIVESSRHRQLKSPDFFEVTKRNGDGGMITAVSRVQNFSTPVFGDPKGAVDGEAQRPWMVGRTKDINNGSNFKILDSEAYQVPHSESEPEEDHRRLAAKASSLKSGSVTESPKCDPGSELDGDPDSDLLQEAYDDADEEYLRKHDLDLSGAEESFVDILEDTRGGHSRDPAGFSSSKLEAAKKSPRAAEKPALFSKTSGNGGGLYKRSEVSRGSLTKSAISRISSTSATSIDLTRSIDTTCSTHSQYDNALWDDPLYSATPRPWDPKSGTGAAQSVIGMRPLPAEVGSIEAQETVLPSSRQGAGGATQSGSKVPRFHDGLEKLAGYMRSASQNARKRRGVSEAEELSSQESCFDYFVDFLESQTSLDLEGLEPCDITDVLVSAHDEARKAEFASAGGGNTLTLMKCLDSRLSNNSLVSDKSVESRVTDVSSESSWESGKSRTVQTLENTGQVMEQIVESVNSLASDSPKYLSSFKFGQKKTAAGALENITTLEVGLESPHTTDSDPSPSRRKYSKQLSKAKSEPSPPQPKLSKQLSKARSWKTVSPVPPAADKHERRAGVGHPLPTPGSITPESRVASGRILEPEIGAVSGNALEQLGGGEEAEAPVSPSGSGNDLTEASHGKLSRAQSAELSARSDITEQLSQRGNDLPTKVDSLIKSERALSRSGSAIVKDSPKEMLMSPPTVLTTKTVREIDVVGEDDRDDLSARHVNKSCGCSIL